MSPGLDLQERNLCDKERIHFSCFNEDSNNVGDALLREYIVDKSVKTR